MNDALGIAGARIKIIGSAGREISGDLYSRGSTHVHKGTAGQLLVSEDVGRYLRFSQLEMQLGPFLAEFEILLVVRDSFRFFLIHQPGRQVG